MAGPALVILELTGRQTDVYSFKDRADFLSNIPFVSAGTKWSDPKIVKGYLLVMNEALYFSDKIGYSLLCPNQL